MLTFGKWLVEAKMVKKDKMPEVSDVQEAEPVNEAANPYCPVRQPRLYKAWQRKHGK